MKEVKHYICDICHTEYNDKFSCQKCEKSHKKTGKIIRSHMEEAIFETDNGYDGETKQMIQEMEERGGYLPVSDLVKRFVEVDEYHNHSLWNLKQIISNIHIFIPMEVEDILNNSH